MLKFMEDITIAKMICDIKVLAKTREAKGHVTEALSLLMAKLCLEKVLSLYEQCCEGFGEY